MSSEKQFEFTRENIDLYLKEVGALLVQFEQDYPKVISDKNVDAIAGKLQKKTDRASILAKLREKKAETEQAKTQQRDDPER